MRYSGIIILSAMFGVVGCAHQQGAAIVPPGVSTKKEAYFGNDSPDWIYQRYLDLSFYLLRHAKMTDKQRGFYRRSEYEFYFEYWLLHDSSRATLQPVLPFEQRFSWLVRREILPHMPGDDPLQIRDFYVDGKFTGPRPLPKMPILTDKDLLRWSDYQQWVDGFRQFVGEAESPKKNIQK
jgi:hypothetical protein